MVLLGLLAFSARAIPPDSLRTIALPTATVAAHRPAYFAAGAHLTTLDSATLAPFATGTLADALLAATPLYVKSYGPGQLASLSIRGTSARHAAVQWHGFNLNFPSLGEADFALLPNAGFRGITVQHGPSSALYGTGAVGGAVVLDNAPDWQPGPRARLQLEAGSFGLWAQRAEAGFSNGRLTTRTTLLNRQATNDFPYEVRTYRGRETQRQVNAALSQQSLTQDVAVRLGQHHELTAAAWLTRADRQIQPSIGSANTHARELDESQRLLLGYAHRTARAETAVRLAYLADRINYRNDQLPVSDARTRSVQTQLEHTRQLGQHFNLRGGAELQRFQARVADYGQRITENRAAFFALLRYATANDQLRVSLNVRQALVLGRRPPLAPTLGAEWRVWQYQQQQLSLKGNVARSYRAPTLNERYWQPGGNPALLPETGFGYEGGLRYGNAERWTAELTAYQLTVDDWVQWTPGAGSIWSPQNLRQVRTRGVEATVERQWRLGAYAATVQAGYALTDAQKVSGYVTDASPAGLPLPYVPRHTATLAVRQNWQMWQLQLQGNLTSQRYTTASANTALPGYGLLNATLERTLRWQQNWQLSGRAQVFNLTDTAYQSYEGRAAPGRSWQLGLALAWR